MNNNQNRIRLFLNLLFISIFLTNPNIVFAAQHNSSPKTIILSVDGGGIKGVIPATLIKHIESKLNKPSHQLFDIIGGTSTGGIIAAALTTPKEATGRPYTAEQIVNIYQSDGGKIFLAQDCKIEQCATYHSDNGKGEGIEPYMQKMYGKTLSLANSHSKMQSLTHNRVKHMFTTSYIVNNKQGKASTPQRGVNYGPYLFNWFDAVNSPATHDYFVWEATRATSAAPTFFPIAQVGGGGSPRSFGANMWVVDGGTMSNNPAVWSVTEAIRTGIATRLEDIVVISLGDGIYEGSAGVGINSNAIEGLVPKEGNWGMTPWMLEKVDDIAGADHTRGALMGVVLDAVQTVTNSQLTALTKAGLKYHRLEPKLTYEQSHMDNISPKNIESLIKTADAYINGEGKEAFNAILKDLR